MSDNREFACRDAVELFSDYLEGVLGEDLSELCEKHLAECTPCVRYLGQLNLTVQSLRALAGNGLPDHVKRALLEEFRRFTKRS